MNRERSSGYYGDFSYFMGKQFCEFPRALFFNLLMILIVYFMAGLNPTAGAFFTLLLITVLLALAGEGLAQMISVFAGDEQTAAALVPVFVIFQVLFGGFFIQPNAMPGYIKWVRWLSFVYYGYNASTMNEFNGRNGNEMIDAEIIENLETDLGIWANIGIIIGYAAILKLGYFTAFTLKKPRFDHNL